MNVLGRRRELARMSKPELIDRVIELEACVPDVGGVDARPDGWDEFDEQLMRAAVRGARDTDRENGSPHGG